MLPRDGAEAGCIWVAIPVYNNRETVRDVASLCRTLVPQVVVVDDGSTDADVEALLAGLDVTVLKHQQNRGKGEAILTAARFAEERSGIHMITIDADGQHDPADIRTFFPLLQNDEPVLVVGARDFATENVPASSRFGRRFANFWLRMETGVELDDCQSGFRSYPVRYLNRLAFKGSHYDFEAEVLAKAAWAGLILREVPISVSYPPPGERVSSFRPFLDNLRLTLIHSMLVGRRLAPWRHRRLVGDKKKADWSMIFRPRQFLGTLLGENATPGGLAAAAVAGTFIGALPIPFHTGAIFYVASRFRLNMLMALNIQHLCMPPFVPALCIEVGHYMRYGRWLTDLSFQSVFSQFSDRLLEWVLGSLVVAPVAALLVGTAVYGIAVLVMKSGVRAWIDKKLLSSKEGTG
ncbi:MAG: hypothetical protein A2X56_08435 [Nitrospirae bacterium GWC2_57_13]|jgi:glycosyltransferase involved in cell wall biosynthesis|nr:MAG: hypothetical protein A2072_05065 [Nitrospirae bacterium GWC1_57_7]OGW29113.1 MAG: hypothetical protein A2X56_08435 [Nitrospirae bacterium GWC2_57_13]HAR45734.1 DUF2062 domain-containing protein [Nitrospiraceae bacterium]HAS55505.1 DUF2062 domain-containing protein [Nitrospiraceae bacterium]